MTQSKNSLDEFMKATRDLVYDEDTAEDVVVMTQQLPKHRQLSKVMWWLLLILLCAFITIDVAYFARTFIAIILSRIRRMQRQTHILDEVVSPGICLPTDIDICFHMNNVKYLRDYEFAKTQWYDETAVWETGMKLGGFAYTTSHNTLYRREIRLFQVFLIRTKLIYWDEKSIYLRQKHESREGFTCAVSISKHTFLGTTPKDIIYELNGEDIESPEPPEELAKILEFIDISRQKLRKRN